MNFGSKPIKSHQKNNVKQITKILNNQRLKNKHKNLKKKICNRCVAAQHVPCCDMNATKSSHVAVSHHHAAAHVLVEFKLLQTNFQVIHA